MQQIIQNLVHTHQHLDFFMTVSILGLRCEPSLKHVWALEW